MPPYTFSTTVKNYPKLIPYETIKNDVLGKHYSLSFILVGKTRAKKINQATRKKDYVPNVLSFPLDKNCGEIILCPEVARPEAKNFYMSQDGYIAFLFIHGLLHLKGYDHGTAMEKMEKRFVVKYGLV